MLNDDMFTVGHTGRKSMSEDHNTRWQKYVIQTGEGVAQPYRQKTDEEKRLFEISSLTGSEKGIRTHWIRTFLAEQKRSRPLVEEKRVEYGAAGTGYVTFWNVDQHGELTDCDRVNLSEGASQLFHDGRTYRLIW